MNTKKIAFGLLFTCLLIGALIVAGLAGFSFGYRLGLANSMGFAIVEARYAASNMLNADNDAYRDKATRAFISGIGYLEHAGLDFSELDQTSAQSLCIITRHREQIIGQITKTEPYSASYISHYLDSAASVVEVRAQLDVPSLGYVDPCNQPP